jgi:purine-cytosine permease-like protein
VITDVTTSELDRAEAPYTLDEPAPRALRRIDQYGLWGNLGVSLLGFTGALFVLEPTSGGPLSLGAALVALLVGTVLGGLALGASAVPGARTGAPAMVLLRGLFGTRPSYLPTVLNVLQLLGWSTFELVTIGTALHQIAGGVPRWAYILVAGGLTTVLALRPLTWIRALRKYVTMAVVIALVYLLVTRSPARSSATAPPRSSATGSAWSPSSRWRTRTPPASSARSWRCPSALLRSR